MSLLSFEPFRQLDPMRRNSDHFFHSDMDFNQQSGFPRIDVYETDREIVATCEIPGLEQKDDVNVRVSDDMLSVNGTVKRRNDSNEENMHNKERFFGHFQRTISLPAPVSSEANVKATYKNGILEVRIPKLDDDSDEKKKINVEFH